MLGSKLNDVRAITVDIILTLSLTGTLFLHVMIQDMNRDNSDHQCRIYHYDLSRPGQGQPQIVFENLVIGLKSQRSIMIDKVLHSQLS